VFDSGEDPFAFLNKKPLKKIVKENPEISKSVAEMKPLKEVFVEKLTLSEEDSISTQASKLSKGELPKPSPIFP
jgi:hypothetical protein